MIKKILLIPLKVIRFILLGVGVVVFISVGICDFFIIRREDIDPIRYSSGGKVVDLNEYKRETE